MAHEAVRRTYSAYHHPTTFEPDMELAGVGRGTPGGEYLRRFWHPIEFSHELKDAPKRIRILGEDLVLFRDKSDRVGLVMPNCPHRGASLEFGQIDECGIRCCYHGWLIDIDGRILETPAEAPSCRTKDVVTHGAYPVQEYKGLIFAYMGPPEKKPPLPIFDFYDIPGNDMKPGGLTPGRKYVWPTNWLHARENAMDPVHLSFLHTIISGTQFTDNFGIVPELEFLTTPIGVAYISARRVNDNVWVRLHDLIMPNITAVCSIQEDGVKPKQFGPPYMINWVVPIDDHNHMQLGFIAENDEMVWTEEFTREIHLAESADHPYEERQQKPGDYDAIVSQGPINLHAREHLAPTDKGVVLFRRLLREGIGAVQRGDDPRELDRSGGVIRTHSQNAVIEAAPPATPEAEQNLLREIGRRVFNGEYRPAFLKDARRIE